MFQNSQVIKLSKPCSGILASENLGDTHTYHLGQCLSSAAKNADLEKSIFKRLSAAYIYHFIAVGLCRLASCLLSTASKVSYLARMCGSVCQSQLCPKCSTDKNICSQLTDPQDTGGTGFQDKYPKQWHVLFSVHNDMPRQMEYGPNYMKHKANLTLVMHCLSSTPAKPVRKI